MSGDEGYVSDNRRKIIAGLGSIVAGGIAAGAVTQISDQKDIVLEDGQVCYETESDEYLGRQITMELEGQNSDFVISEALEETDEEKNKACFREEEIESTLGSDYKIREVRVGEKTLYKH